MTNKSEPADPHIRLSGASQHRASDRYFFDVDDGNNACRDDTGLVLSSADEIASEAYNILKQIVHDQWPEGQRTMTVRVRDQSGKLVYTGTMTVDGQRGPAR